MNSIISAAKKLMRRPGFRTLTVRNVHRLTPNMIRITLFGPDLQDIPESCPGGHCKLVFPAKDETAEQFQERLNGAAKVTPVRTFTIRHFRKDQGEMDIDFVAHGDHGPASRWSSAAKPGDVIGFAGPGAPKLTEFDADWYLVAADMSALPVAAVTLELMPRDARGIAVLEITSDADRQEIDMPSGVECHWLIHPDPDKPSHAQEKLLRDLDWPSGRLKTCIAGESTAIRSLRQLLHKEKELPRADTYISGYWKVGLVEDEHRKVKRQEAAG